MYRGTTKTLTFALPFAGEQITALNLCFAQQGEIVLEKSLNDFQIDGKVIRTKLTEEETLLFDAKKIMVDLQLRIGCGETRMASNIIHIPVGRLLKDGCLE